MNTKPWYVYLLLCDQKTFYVGITDNLKQRIHEHTHKESFFTSKFSDLQLKYAEKYPSKAEAANREKQLKGWSHTKKQLLIDGILGYNRVASSELVEVFSVGTKDL